MAGSDLVISVGASIKDLERQMKAAAKVAEQAADEIEGKFRRANPSFAGNFGLGVLQGAIAAISFEKITRGIIDANKEIASFGETARRVGLDIARFQEFRLAASREGIEGKTFDAGVDALSAKLNEARQQENALTKLLDENNVKYKDRKGEIVSTNEALALAADLISRAATEQDKVKIAEAFGLPKDFVPLLENGAEALQKLAQNARESGSILDAEVIQKAKEFDQAWNSAWASFAAYSKSSIVTALTGLSQLNAEAQKWFENSKFSPLSVGMAARNAVTGVSPITDDAESRRGRGFAGIGQDTGPLVVDVKKRTKTGSLFNKGGGGGGGSSGKSEAEGAQDRLDRYIETLMRQNSVLDAEIATFGKSNAEKRAAVELAKAQVDLNKLDEAERQKIIASLTKEIDLSEQKRTKLAELKQAQDGLRDAQKFFGDAAVDALEDLIVNGAKAEDVIKRLAASLVKAALQAALLGQGPLAGIFGTAGTGGNMGGLFGMFGSMFGRATGGPVNAGQAYRVGERGPETFVPTTPGRIVPAGRGGGGITVNVQNNTPAQVETKPRSDGGFDMIIRQVDGALAQRVAHGQGSLSMAFSARQTNRHLRG